jgi:hypothetical protein
MRMVSPVLGPRIMGQADAGPPRRRGETRAVEGAPRAQPLPTCALAKFTAVWALVRAGVLGKFTGTAAHARTTEPTSL